MKEQVFTVGAGLLTPEELLKNVSELKIPIVTNNKKISYYNIPVAFDIEVSSFYQGGVKKSCMYVWQFGIFNWVTYGRTWSEYKAFISVLSSILQTSHNMRLICYIHNFGYEFQFMRKHFKWDDLFFLEERKPVYGLVNGIEYRCSLKLSGKSLKNVGKDLRKYKVEKKVGDLDYSLIRTSKTPLTKKELGYCENDIRVLLSYIQEKIEIDGNISLIPLTNTGYVRRYCKKSCYKDYTFYKNLMSVLTLDADEYSQQKRAFAGGFVHASARYAEKILYDVGSVDFISAYPAKILLEEFPFSKCKVITKIDSPEEFVSLLSNKCCLLDITFKGLEERLPYDHPMSLSKTIKRLNKNVKVDNGRIVSADSVTTTCTEQDLFIYGDFYKWKSFEVHSMRVYEKSYLPTSLVKAILELYKNKTVLKGVESEEVNYLLSKGMLNSAYGMMVTDIVREIVSYNNDTFRSTKPDLQESLEKYNKSRNRFLFYPWGVWVTAYARYSLFTGIKACKDDYVYSDTDSIKIMNPHKHMDYIESYNKGVLAKIEKAAKFHKISVDEFSPLNIKGEKKTIGLWEYEGTYDRFKTLGAKRYMTQKGDKYSITVAGLNKELGMKYLASNYKDPFKAFKDGMEIPKSNSGRLTLTYNDDRITGSVIDYMGNEGDYDELSSIHMEQSTYKLEISDTYRKFLDMIAGRKEIVW